MGKADIGMVGLAVMGQNLVLNMHDHGFKVAVYNRKQKMTAGFMAGPAANTDIIPTQSYGELAAAVKRPRKIMMMIKAGAPVDSVIEALLPHLEPGDILIDGGNSHYPDTERRVNELKEKGIFFIGTGISGGEEGARHGPSIMPGGNPEAWPHVKPILQAIAAKVGEEPCCDWVGEGGAGHYVKMVHNGIEYGDMQLICEAYQLMKRALGSSNAELSKTFAEWNKGELDSYLIEITSQIFAFKENGEELIDKILDVAGQKGTGKWTVISAADMGMPLTLIGEAVFARCLSALKEERTSASKLFSTPHPEFTGDPKAFTEQIRQALYASKIVSYAQGYMLMRQAAADYGWKLNYGGIALMWRGGCIIRSAFLGNIKEAYDKDPSLQNLLMSPFFKEAIQRCEKGWRQVVSQAALLAIPSPCFSTALSYFDGYKTERLPANLLQAQRDFFGAHTYERVDRPRGQFTHTNWTGTGGAVSSSTYNA
ncbi:MAG: decarboxylating NADP(+)-dependent phosphogluconate dehydrogenase [Parachlamydiales bacterium]